MQTGYAIYPRSDCIHYDSLDLNFGNLTSSLFSSPCSTCGDAQESWFCLTCKTIGCSSYTNGHMKEHYSLSSHPIVLSFNDLSIWCYECNSYITSKILQRLVKELGDLKFNEVKETTSMPLDDVKLEEVRLDDLRKELEAAKGAKEVGGMYAVTPKDDCPHVCLENLAEDYSVFDRIQVNTACGGCSNTNENWVCLKCGDVKCSRYVNEHMLMHALESSHALALSFSDLSFWCYACESYIVDLDLHEIYEMFQKKKFGNEKPNAYNTTAHTTEEEKIEYFDTEEELEEKISILASWIQESKYFIAFTGAGISTSAGIPDFRSGFNTVLPTGAGCWERKAVKNRKAPKASVRTSLVKALPTSTHMAFVEMMRVGHLKYVLSQNVDGLHRKSGIPPEKIAELHGNANVEKCKKCKMEYMRDYGVRNNPNVHMHETGNYCDNPECGGELYDTIINFGENLDEDVLVNSANESEKADLCLAMGSSLRVNPAAMFAKDVSKHGRLVIVNLQKTPLDRSALVIHALCDVVMTRLMIKLNLEVPKFFLRRHIGISHKNHAFNVRGLDFNGAPYSILTKVIFSSDPPVEVTKAPFSVSSSVEFSSIVLFFQGHYEEPSLELAIPSSVFSKHERVHEIVYDPEIRQWI